MSNKLIDIYHRILKYNDNKVYIAFETNTQDVYFHAKELCQMLGYKDYRDALRQHVNKKDIRYLQDIIKNYKSLYKNVQGHTKFINEAGLYSLIIKSKMKKAIEITDWITHEVMPSVRKYGEYKLTHELKQQIDELNKEIDILNHNLKNPKYKTEESVYIIQNIENSEDININIDDILYLKFGRTKDINKRIKVYNTSNKNKVKILKVISVENSKIIEDCVIKKMHNYKIKDNKEYFKCSFNQLVKQIAECIKFYENREVNTEIDINELKRTEYEYFIKIIDDFDFFENSDDEYSENNLSDNESDIDDDLKQIGGDNNIKFKYLKYKLKYMQLKYDLL